MTMRAEMVDGLAVHAAVADATLGRTRRLTPGGLGDNASIMPAAYVGIAKCWAHRSSCFLYFFLVFCI